MTTLEEVCPECKGVGQIESSLKTRKGTKKFYNTCPVCGGRKKVLTEFGRAVLQLVRDYTPWDNEMQNVQDELRDLKREDERLASSIYRHSS